MRKHAKVVSRGIFYTLCCLPCLISQRTLLCQTTNQQKAMAPNAWMKQVPQPSSQSPSVSPEQRGQRDAFADKAFGGAEPLTPDTAGRNHISEGSVVYGNVPEIPPLGPESAVIVARFNSYVPVLSDSHRSVYTEINLAVQQVVHAAGDPLHPGDSITVLRGGGTVVYADGRVLSYLADPASFSIQPNHTYLLIVSRKSDGQFYLVDKGWDVSTGIVTPNDLYETIRTQRGEAQLAGLPLDTAVSILTKATSSTP
jgi:hypothetical protein